MMTINNVMNTPIPPCEGTPVGADVGLSVAMARSSIAVKHDACNDKLAIIPVGIIVPNRQRW